jgi:hypothetical protein
VKRGFLPLVPHPDVVIKTVVALAPPPSLGKVESGSMPIECGSHALDVHLHEECRDRDHDHKTTGRQPGPPESTDPEHRGVIYDGAHRG